MDQHNLDKQEVPRWPGELLPSPPTFGNQPFPSAKGVAAEVVGLLFEELRRMVTQELHMAMAAEAQNLAAVLTVAVQSGIRGRSERSSLSMACAPMAQPDVNVPHCPLNELQELVDNQILGSSQSSTKQIIQQYTRARSASDFSSNRSVISHSTEEVRSNPCHSPEIIVQRKLQYELPEQPVQPLRPVLPVLPGQLFDGHKIDPPSFANMDPPSVAPLNLQLASSEVETPLEDVPRQQPFSRLVQERASELTDEYAAFRAVVNATQGKLPLPAAVYPLCLLGVLPWKLVTTSPTTLVGHCLVSMYQWLGLAILGLSAGLCAHGVVATWLGLDSWEITHPCSADLPLILGTLVGLLLIGIHKGSPRLFLCHCLVVPESRSGDLVSAWKKYSRLDVASSVALWLAAVACRGAAEGDLASPLYLCAFAAWSGALMGLCLCVLHLSNCLAFHVDCFSCGLVHHRRQQLEQQHMQHLTADFVSRWNKVQAMTRRCFNAIERMLIALQFAMVIAVVLATLVFHGGILKLDLHFISLLLLLALIAVAFLRSASVTDRCRRVPSLVNTLVSDSVVDFEWQYLVRFISDSDAGCHINNVPVTTAMVLRFLYFCGAFMFAISNMNIQ